MLMHRLAGMTLLTTLLLTACANAAGGGPPTPTPHPDVSQIFFPQQKLAEGSRDVMDAMLVGRLVLVNACLRLNASENTSYLLVWPQGLALTSDGSSIQVVDAAGQLVAQVGNTLTVSGGEVPAEAIANHVRQPLPAECPGPYWIIGKTISTGA
jgi:hypothetical protein